MHRWPGERSRHGGVDEIPLPVEGGRLWLCGKHFVGPDPEAALTATGAAALVCLCEPHELTDRYPDYVAWMQANGPHRSVWYPVPDLDAPDLDEARALIAMLRARLDGGDGLVVHCGGGIGRAGTLAAALLISMGVPLRDALVIVGRHRPMAGPEAGPQRRLLESLADA